VFGLGNGAEIDVQERAAGAASAPTAPEGEIEHRDYDEWHQRLSNIVLSVFDVSTEVANEASDLAFTFAGLQGAAPDLFYASLTVLAASMLIRLAIALQPLFVPSANFSGNPPIDSTKRWTYWWGVLVSLIEPLSGAEIIHGSRKSFDTDEQIEAQVDLEMPNHDDSERSDRAVELRRVKYNATFAQAVTRLRVTVVMLALEDVPELIIDLVFLFRVGGTVNDSTLFALTLSLTLLHMLRTRVELVFQLAFFKHIPLPLKIDKFLNDDALDSLLSRCVRNPHKYSFVHLDHDSEKASAVVAHLLARGACLNAVRIRSIRPHGVSAIADALRVNTTVTSVECVFAPRPAPLRMCCRRCPSESDAHMHVK
jgi:hypothetical protein